MNGWKACYFLNFGMKEKEKQIPSFWMKTLRGRDEGLKVIQKYFDTKLDMELQALDLSSRLHSLDYQSTQRLKKKKHLLASSESWYPMRYQVICGEKTNVSLEWV